MGKPLILICNSHIDPVWLWEWEEGVSETLSTFRSAVRFCEAGEGFVFCQGDSLLYEWTETSDKSLFSRISQQVKNGTWHIMGGWYLQPDCNMILGESVVRQILAGKKYFLEKFGKEPRTAVNPDSFGHSRGLVQILAGTGYDSYLFCRPGNDNLKLPDETFIWQGFDGSEVLTHRSSEHYNSSRGEAAVKIEAWITGGSNRSEEEGIILWGIGNHGGGATRKDINAINTLKGRFTEWDISHGTAEEYFSLIKPKREQLSVFRDDLNPFAIGCYTSMKKIKQPLYHLEHKYYTAEKIIALSALSGNNKYPADSLSAALKELLFCQFHDILAGTAVEPVEKDVLNRIGFANRIIDNMLSDIFVRASNTLQPPVEDEIPVMVINPHPFDLEMIVETELQLPEPNIDKTMKRTPVLYDNEGKPIDVQSEKPECNIREDNRKKISFRASVPAGGIRRYSCFLKDKPAGNTKEPETDDFTFTGKNTRLIIDHKTGFPQLWEFEDLPVFGKEGMKFAIIEDNADPWRLGKKFFDGSVRYFKPAERHDAARHVILPAGNFKNTAISEKGPVRIIAETVFTSGNSSIHMRYIIPVADEFFDVELSVTWNEKDSILKWMIPVGYNFNTVGRSLSGISCCKHRKREYVFRDWLGMKNFDGDYSFAICADGAYGYDITGNTLRISLLRSPAYSAHPVKGEDDILEPGRIVKRIDQGVHTFRFRFIPGKTDMLIDRSFNNSDIFNNPLITRVVYPSGENGDYGGGIRISDETINLQAVKQDKAGNLVIRALNPCKESRSFILSVPGAGLEKALEIGGRMLKTWVADIKAGAFYETDHLERMMG